MGLAKPLITATGTHSRNGLPAKPFAHEQSGTWNFALKNKIHFVKLVKLNPKIKISKIQPCTRYSEHMDFSGRHFDTYQLHIVHHTHNLNLSGNFSSLLQTLQLENSKEKSKQFHICPFSTRKSWFAATSSVKFILNR